ncbi:MAG TPA: hypothetical protein VD887_00865 [Allosphingosinicella sp.]|nr:hypothetical protein [Allosphingosinicella sp.]
MNSKPAFLIALAAVAACSDLPKDPDGTLKRVERERQFRVGIVESRAGPPAPLRALIARVAAATGARPAIERDAAERLLIRLEDGTLDLVLGEFEREGPWTMRVHMLPALARGRAGSRETVVAAAAAHGENRWIMLVDREARELGGEP